MHVVTVDINDQIKWTSSIQPDADALHFFTSKVAPNYTPEVVQADVVYHLQTYGHAIKFLDLQWESATLLESTGYQIYVYSDQDTLLFTGTINNSTSNIVDDSTVRIYNKTSPDITTRFAFVKIVEDIPGGKGTLNFINCNAVLQK